MLEFWTSSHDQTGARSAFWSHGSNPYPQFPTPNPQTPNPKPQTPNPKPQTSKPKPQIPNSRPQTQVPLGVGITLPSIGIRRDAPTVQTLAAAGLVSPTIFTSLNLVGAFLDTSLDYAPPRAGGVMSLSLSFLPKMDVEAGWNVFLSLPDFVFMVNPKPQPPNSKHQTPNPKPKISNPKPKTQNSKPKPQNPKPKTKPNTQKPNP